MDSWGSEKLKKVIGKALLIKFKSACKLKSKFKAKKYPNPAKIKCHINIELELVEFPPESM